MDLSLLMVFYPYCQLKAFKNYLNAVKHSISVLFAMRLLLEDGDMGVGFEKV